MECLYCGDETHNEESKFCYRCNKRYMRSKNHMIIGMVLFVAGSILTILPLLKVATNSGEGTFFIFWGAIIFGFGDFIKGITDYRRFNKILKDPSKYALKTWINGTDVNEDALQRYFSNKK